MLKRKNFFVATVIFFVIFSFCLPADALAEVGGIEGCINSYFFVAPFADEADVAAMNKAFYKGLWNSELLYAPHRVRICNGFTPKTICVEVDGENFWGEGKTPREALENALWNRARKPFEGYYSLNGHGCRWEGYRLNLGEYCIYVLRDLPRGHGPIDYWLTGPGGVDIISPNPAEIIRAIPRKK